MPERARLEFEVTKNGSSPIILQTAIFDPVGLSGRLYWYGLYPVHPLVLVSKLRGITNQALRLSVPLVQAGGCRSLSALVQPLGMEGKRL